MKSRIATFFVFLIAVAILLISAPLWADDGHGHNHGGGDVDVDTSLSADTDVSVGNSVSPSNRSQSFGISNSLGDVDIGDCVVTKQTSIIVVAWQRYDENPWCQAMVAIQLGQMDMAERILCRDTNWGTYYDDEHDCRENINLQVVPEEPLVDEHFEEEEELHMEQQMLYEDLNSKIRNLEAELNKPPQVTRQIVQQGLTDEQKRALREVANE